MNAIIRTFSHFHFYLLIFLIKYYHCFFYLPRIPFMEIIKTGGMPPFLAIFLLWALFCYSFIAFLNINLATSLGFSLLVHKIELKIRRIEAINM